MSTEALNPAASARRWRDAADRCGYISRVAHWVVAAPMIGMLAWSPVEPGSILPPFAGRALRARVAFEAVARRGTRAWTR